jgi:hypothetical protein
MVELRLTSDEELRRMQLGEALRWAADINGYLTSERRLERLALARGYKRGWVSYVYSRHWHEVWTQCVRWRKGQHEQQVEDDYGEYDD